MITLLTDFGLSDPSVGEMKGVLLSIAPDATLVDLTHGVEAGNVREAAWILSRTWRTFPEGTCHLVVVDPGVGTQRRG
ncbi:SAM-dependent chlorinase/fluorinase, partial [bacterium]|nr:SAM-dependent chlorinase/fluorinase [bacterium]